MNDIREDDFYTKIFYFLFMYELNFIVHYDKQNKIEQESNHIMQMNTLLIREHHIIDELHVLNQLKTEQTQLHYHNQ